MGFSPAFSFAPRLPKTESYLSRCARVFVSVMSFTATKSMSPPLSDARSTLRPMRPKPLMPTLIAMFLSPVYETTLHDEISRLKLTDEVIERVLDDQRLPHLSIRNQRLDHRLHSRAIDAIRRK